MQVILATDEARQRDASGSRIAIVILFVLPSVTLLGSAKTVRDSALVTMGK